MHSGWVNMTVAITHSLWVTPVGGWLRAIGCHCQGLLEAALGSHLGGECMFEAMTATAAAGPHLCDLTKLHQVWWSDTKFVLAC